jgi:hypothetical protein
MLGREWQRLKRLTLSEVLEGDGELPLRETLCVLTRNGTSTLGVQGVAGDRLPHSMCLRMQPLYCASSSRQVSMSVTSVT